MLLCVFFSFFVHDRRCFSPLTTRVTSLLSKPKFFLDISSFCMQVILQDVVVYFFTMPDPQNHANRYIFFFELFYPCTILCFFSGHQFFSIDHCRRKAVYTTTWSWLKYEIIRNARISQKKKKKKVNGKLWFTRSFWFCCVICVHYLL